MAPGNMNVNRTGVYGLAALTGGLGMYYLLMTNVDWWVSISLVACGVLLAMAGMYQDKNEMFG